MEDKFTTLLRAKFGRSVGRLSADDILNLDRAVLVLLGPAERLRPAVPEYRLTPLRLCGIC
jgi:hypothetical protein